MIALVTMMLALAAATPATDMATTSGSPASPSPSATPPPQQTVAPVRTGAPAPVASTPAAPRRAQASLEQQHAMIGDFAGGQYIPAPILKILADRRVDPDVAYMLWQLSRRPLDDWTLSELALVAQIAPTEVEAGLPIELVQALYQFWGLDPDDVFNPTLGSNWQAKSTAYSTESAANVAAISTAECQVDVSQMTLGTFRSCIGAAQ